MAKKVTAVVKLQLQAGKATPGPPVGSTLGPYGINLPGFTKEFNAKTQDKLGYVIPVVITIYADRSFTFVRSRSFLKLHQHQNLLKKRAVLKLQVLLLIRTRLLK